MVHTNFVALRGINSFHMVDRQTIREVEVGERRTRIITPHNVIEVENRYNVDALNSLCKGSIQELVKKDSEKSRKLYPRLKDLPF